MINPTAIACLLSAAVAGGGAWVWQANAYERQIATIQTEYAQAQHKAVEHAHAETVRYQQKADAATKAAAQRVRAADSERAVLRGAVERLRLATTSTMPPSTDTGATTGNDGSAARVVSAECADALATMAGNADGWRIEAMTLREAWPTQE